MYPPIKKLYRKCVVFIRECGNQSDYLKISFVTWKFGISEQTAKRILESMK